MQKILKVLVSIVANTQPDPNRFKQSFEALGAFCDDVTDVPVEDDRKRIHEILRNLTEPAQLRLAHCMLAVSKGMKCKTLAVELDPRFGKICADEVMVIARQQLKVSDSAVNAHEASSLLYHAQAWYEAAGALTPELDIEIRQGLDMIAWAHH